MSLLVAAVLFVVESVLDRRRRRQAPDAPSAATIGVLVAVGGLLVVTAMILLGAG